MMKIRQGARFGDWTLTENLDAGGNGVVWVAKRSDGSPGAIKFLQKKHHRNKKRVLRFQDEIAVMRKCQDIHGVLPLLDDSANGHTTTVGNWFVSVLAVPLEKALGADKGLEVVVQACASYASTLAEMHKRGFSHRDIKPENLFLYQNNWMIGDFGLANFPGKTKITSAMERVGPLFYIAPEMLNDASKADGRPADVYSLAKTLWKLGTGQKYPLPGEQQCSVEALTLSAYVRDPDAYLLDSVIEKSTMASPESRLTMAQLAGELHAWLQLKRTPSDPTGVADELRKRRKQLDVDSVNERHRPSRFVIDRLRDLILPSFEAMMNALSEQVESVLVQRRLALGEIVNQSQYAYKLLTDAVNQDKTLVFGNLRSIQVRDRSATSCTFLVFGVIAWIDDYSTLALEGTYKWVFFSEYAVRNIWTEGSPFILDSPRQELVIRQIALGLHQNATFAVDAVAAAMEPSRTGDADSTERREVK